MSSILWPLVFVDAVGKVDLFPSASYLLDEEDMESDSVFSQRFTAKRLHELAKSKLSPNKRKYIDETGFGDLKSISPFTVSHDLMEWLTMNIDTGKRELRLNRNKVIVFTRDMVRKVFNIPSRNKLVELYKRHKKCDLRNIYHKNGRAPIAHTVHVLYKAVSDDGDTTKRSWVLLAIATVLTRVTGNMVPLEYLKSLEEIEKVTAYAWDEHVLSVAMNEVIYMDHFIFPQATINKHHLNYSLPRACFVQQTDFDIVWEYDNNKLSLGKASFGKCRLPPHLAKIYAKHTKLYVAELKGATNSFVQVLQAMHCSNNAPKVGERGGSKQTSITKASHERGGNKKNYSRKVADEPTTNKVVVEPAEGARRNRSGSSAHEPNACNVAPGSIGIKVPIYDVTPIAIDPFSSRTAIGSPKPEGEPVVLLSSWEPSHDCDEEKASFSSPSFGMAIGLFVFMTSYTSSLACLTRSTTGIWILLQGICFDCGYFGVSYFENFDGKRMEDFKKQNMLDMQKYLSSKPIYHPLKKVSPADAHKAIVAA
ncbi:hypothetical protein D1007_32222 [Hordeum vulgare]|nr:hypothetical protein D1007_32222 [Hordeum vulgare]